MPVTISRAQLDAIYELVINHLTAIGDVWLCVERCECATAERIGREFAEDLRRLKNLGWAAHIDGETVALSQPPDEPKRTLARMHHGAWGRWAPTSRGSRTRRTSLNETLRPPRRSARSSARSPKPLTTLWR
jgi:hypothetical protein